MEMLLIVAIDRCGCVVSWTVFHTLAIDIDAHQIIRPLDFSYRSWGDKDLSPWPPVPRIDDYVMYTPIPVSYTHLRPATGEEIPLVLAESAETALSKASGPSRMPPVIWPRSAILQSAAASSVDLIFSVTISIADRIATRGSGIPKACARSIAFWIMSRLSASVG